MNRLIPYYRARYYSPQIGRFISRDGLENAEQSQGPNLYWYVQDNPTNWMDPTGRLTWGTIGGYGAGIVSAAFVAITTQIADSDIPNMQNCPTEYTCKKECLDCVSYWVSVLKSDSELAIGVGTAACYTAGAKPSVLGAALATACLAGMWVTMHDLLNSIQSAALDTINRCKTLQ